jgi:purine-binding chemotaxis protein CheW
MKELYVLFKVNSVDYALPASDVLYMDSYTGATRVPGAPEYVVGLVQIRARVVTVVDLRARFGLGPTKPELETRVIVVKREPRTVGLLVESAREVVLLEPEQLRDPPDILTGGAGLAVRSVAQIGSRLVMLVDVDRLIGTEIEGQRHGEQRT